MVSRGIAELCGRGITVAGTWSQPFAARGKKELLPGFEPGSVDSKSTVLTITPQERVTC